jgi:hypothetical protein
MPCLIKPPRMRGSCLRSLWSKASRWKGASAQASGREGDQGSRRCRRRAASPPSFDQTVWLGLTVPACPLPRSLRRRPGEARAARRVPRLAQGKSRYSLPRLRQPRSLHSHLAVLFRWELVPDLELDPVPVVCCCRCCRCYCRCRRCCWAWLGDFAAGLAACKEHRLEPAEEKEIRDRVANKTGTSVAIQFGCN